MYVPLRNLCVSTLRGCVCLYGGSELLSSRLWEKQTDLSPALQCLIPLLAQPWACLVTFDTQMIGPYWRERAHMTGVYRGNRAECKYTAFHKHAEKNSVVHYFCVFMLKLGAASAVVVNGNRKTYHFVQSLLSKQPRGLQHSPRVRKGGY